MTDSKAAGSADAVEAYYWLTHPEHCWIAAKKLRDTANGGGAFATDDGVSVEKTAAELKGAERISAASLNADVSNLVALDEFGDGPILDKLRSRYRRDAIYTHIGSILISINPYKPLPIYLSSVVAEYRRGHQALPPHVFGIAAEAYRSLLDDRRSQAVIISGESGAGKTEATKMILQFLSDAAQSAAAAAATDSGPPAGVEQEILQSNPILEAFGNAKTVRNNNSSRFGKWAEIRFTNGDGRIVAARIVNYLLEKSRVITLAKNERNYHGNAPLHLPLSCSLSPLLTALPMAPVRCCVVLCCAVVLL
jgi:myosin heavy subunit